jgi:hypothetical protein
MIPYRKLAIEDKYWGVEIMECPIEIMLFAARLGYDFVTIENFRHYRNRQRVKIEIDNLKGGSITPMVSRFELDFQLAKAEFLQLDTIWDVQGCYAVFHQMQSIKFKITDLDSIKRYRALDNFQWNVELAIPGPASNGWGQIMSPDRQLIEQVIKEIQKEG